MKQHSSIVHLDQDSAAYPSQLHTYFGARTPSRITAIGNIGLLKGDTLALLCSKSCPGSLILKTYDIARDLRSKGTAVISGFHSPIEQEVLNILL